MTGDFLETFAGTVRTEVCNTSACQTNPIGVLEGRYLCSRCFERRARLMPLSRLEARLEGESDPILRHKLRDALEAAREWETEVETA